MLPAQKNIRDGFTLIELLIVMALIGVLATAVIVAINPNKRLAQARDAQRKSDINSIANAIVGFEALTGAVPASRVFGSTGCDRSVGSTNDCSFVPLSSTWSTGTGIYYYLIQSQEFLKKLPVDPKNDSTYYYWYHATPQPPPFVTTTQYYWIGARLESPANPANPIFRCSDYPTLTKGCKEVSNYLL